LINAKAFDHLLEIGFVQYIQTEKLNKLYRKSKLLMLVPDVVEGLQLYKDCPTNLLKWGTSWVE
jgi:hypothetical protein